MTTTRHKFQVATITLEKFACNYAIKGTKSALILKRSNMINFHVRFSTLALFKGALQRGLFKTLCIEIPLRNLLNLN